MRQILEGFRVKFKFCQLERMKILLQTTTVTKQSKIGVNLLSKPVSYVIKVPVDVIKRQL